MINEMAALTRIVAVVAALALLQAGCGGDAHKKRSTAGDERSDPPVQPPPGWRTITNPSAGFTIAAPRTWTATSTPRRTVIRSDDRLVAMSISADRTATGRELSAEQYGRRTIRTLAHFAGIVGKRASRVPDSKYQSAIITAIGTVKPSNLSQRISVAIFHIPGKVTYGAVVFRNAGVTPRFNDRTIARILGTFRAQPPRY